MKTVINPKSQVIINYLLSKGHTKENPLVLDEPITINHLCESPGRYTYSYPHEVLLLWVDNDTLTVRARYNKEETYQESSLIKFTKAVGEFYIIDDEIEPEDIDDSFGNEERGKVWYWEIDSLLEYLFKEPRNPTSYCD